MKTTFIYKEKRDFKIQGDFYQIKQEQAPLIVYLHGGGLIWGSRTDIQKEQVKMYKNAGYNVCSIDYRLAPETRIPDIAIDIQDALVWLKEEGSKKFDFDTERIAIIGSSAGGYLSLLTGTFQVKPQAIVSFYGYGNILASWYTQPSAHFNAMTKVPPTLASQLIMKHPITEAPAERRYAIYLHYRQQGIWLDHITGLNKIIDRDQIQTYCPVNNISETYPPTLLLHGDADKDVPYSESVQMSQALSKQNIPNELITIPNGEHLFDEQMDSQVAINAVNKVITFLDQHL